MDEFNLPDPFSTYSYFFNSKTGVLEVFNKHGRKMTIGESRFILVSDVDGKRKSVSVASIKKMIGIDEGTSEKSTAEKFGRNLNGPFLPIPVMPGFWINEDGVVKTSTGILKSPFEVRGGNFKYLLQYGGRELERRSPSILVWEGTLKNISFSEWYIEYLSQEVGYVGSDISELEKQIKIKLRKLSTSPLTAMGNMWREMFGEDLATIDDVKKFKETLQIKTRMERNG